MPSHAATPSSRPRPPCGRRELPRSRRPTTQLGWGGGVAAHVRGGGRILSPPLPLVLAAEFGVGLPIPFRCLLLRHNGFAKGGYCAPFLHFLHFTSFSLVLDCGLDRGLDYRARYLSPLLIVSTKTGSKAYAGQCSSACCAMSWSFSSQ